MQPRNVIDYRSQKRSARCVENFAVQDDILTIRMVISCNVGSPPPCFGSCSNFTLEFMLRGSRCQLEAFVYTENPISPGEEALSRSNQE